MTNRVVRLKVLPRFPVAIQGANGDKATIDSGVVTVQPDYGSLANSGIIAAPASTFIRIWDSVGGGYVRAPVSALPVNLPGGAWTNVRIPLAGDDTLQNTDKAKVIALGGAKCFTLTVGAASSYDSNYVALIVNEDAGRAKILSISGYSPFFLGPLQQLLLINLNNVWLFDPPGRWRPTGTTTFYVTTGGNNSGHDGLANTSAGSFLTLAGAYQFLYANLDANGQSLVIKMADGIYNGDNTFGGRVTGTGTTNPIAVVGNTGTPSNVALVGTGITIRLYNGAAATLSGLHIECPSGLYGVEAQNASFIGLAGNLEFGTCGAAQLVGLYGGTIEDFAGYTVAGGTSPFHALADVGGRIISQSKPITLIGGPVFASGMLVAGRGGVVQYTNPILTGSTGAGSKKYNAFLNGVVTTSGTFTPPGSVAGTTSLGGQFD